MTRCKLSFLLGTFKWAKDTKKALSRSERSSREKEYARACYQGFEAIEKGLKTVLHAEGLISKVRGLSDEC